MNRITIPSQLKPKYAKNMMSALQVLKNKNFLSQEICWFIGGYIIKNWNSHQTKLPGYAATERYGRF